MPTKFIGRKSLPILICLASTVNATELPDGVYTVTVQDNYETVTSVLNDAIINQGLVIDYVGDVGAMLKRTGGDVGENSPYANASYQLFCSAKNTHAAVAADPKNIALCPYTVFSYELRNSPGEVVVGYRRPLGIAGAASVKAAKAIERLLKSVVDEVAQ